MSTLHFLLPSILVLCSCQLTSGQTLSGQVQETDGKPLPFANVLLLSGKDSSLVKGAVTTDAGTFRIENIRYGSYLTAVSMIGYEKTYSAPFIISQAQPDVRLPLLTVHAENRQLSEVMVVAQKPLYEQQIDKLVVNVASTLTAAGSTALDVLERSPGIVVNRQNNALSMSGKNGVLVMINGKISRLPMDAVIQMLSGMQASTIEKVELITNPSALYDAEGDAGIINIVLKKNADYGTNGNISLSMGYGWYEKPSGSLNLNHRHQKLNFFGDYSAGRERGWFGLSTYINLRYQNQFTENSILRNSYNMRQAQSARLGLDYQLSEKTTLGVLATGFNNLFKANTRSKTEILYSGELNSRLWMHEQEGNHWKHAMANLNLKHKLSNQSEINLDADYLLYHNSSPHDYQNEYEYVGESSQSQDLIDIAKKTPIHMWVLKGDYSLNLGSKSKLEAGAKTTLMNLENKLTVSRNEGRDWEVDQELSQHFILQDNISAAYTNLNHSFNDKTKLQAGLRYEYTFTDIRPPGEPATVQRRYGSVFPSVFLSHDLSKKSSLQGSYSRRIQRPDYSLLAPWVIFTSPYTFITGNPTLLPTFTDALGITYRFKESYLLSIKYSHDRNALDRFRVLIDSTSNRTYVTPQNVRSVNTMSLTFTFPLQVTKWWGMQNNVLGIWQHATTNINGYDFSVSQKYANLSSSHRFTLPFGFSGEIKALYQTPFLWGTNRMKANGSIDAGLQKKLSRNNGSLTIGITDIFWMQGMRAVSLMGIDGQYSRWQALWEPRVVRVTYAKSFGNQKVKGARQRVTGSDEERRRVGN
jgi:hypothetical protein